MLSGKFDARDRKQARGRRERKREVEPHPWDMLDDHLAVSNLRELDDARLVDLDAFLFDTQHIDMGPDERLRHLAIFLEPSVSKTRALDRIYDKALTFAPNSAAIHHSRGITARLGALDEAHAGNPKLAERLKSRSQKSLYAAYELDASCPRMCHSIGKWHYDFGKTQDALEGVSADPSFLEMFRRELHGPAQTPQACTPSDEDAARLAVLRHEFEFTVTLPTNVVGEAPEDDVTFEVQLEVTVQYEPE